MQNQRNRRFHILFINSSLASTQFMFCLGDQSTLLKKFCGKLCFTVLQSNQTQETARTNMKLAAPSLCSYSETITQWKLVFRRVKKRPSVLFSNIQLIAHLNKKKSATESYFQLYISNWKKKGKNDSSTTATLKTRKNDTCKQYPRVLSFYVKSIIEKQNEDIHFKYCFS